MDSPLKTLDLNPTPETNGINTNGSSHAVTLTDELIPRRKKPAAVADTDDGGTGNDIAINGHKHVNGTSGSAAIAVDETATTVATVAGSKKRSAAEAFDGSSALKKAKPATTQDDDLVLVDEGKSDNVILIE